MNINEKLMRRIERCVYKSIKESFSDWKEQNVPKFDEVRFKEYMGKLLNVLKELIDQKEVTLVSFLWFDDTNNWRSIYRSDKTPIGDDTTYEIMSMAEKYMGDGFVTGMKRTCLKLNVDPNRYFHRYIEDNLSMNRNCIVNDEYIKVSQQKDGSFSVMISTDDIIEYFDRIYVFIS